jgi:hypothetical protein
MTGVLRLDLSPLSTSCRRFWPVGIGHEGIV